MIRSMLKQLQLGERDQTLLSFIDKAMKVEERKKLLESYYSQELSLLYILQEDYDRAKYYTNHAMQLFMEVRSPGPSYFLFISSGLDLDDSVCSMCFASCRVTPAWTLCSLKVDSPFCSQFRP